jgi:hypothetical protein
MALVRRLWTEENVTYRWEHFGVTSSTVVPRPVVRGDRRHPRLYVGGASEPPNGWPPPGPTSSSSGASRTTASMKASSASPGSDTPYLPEIKRQGEQLLPLLPD